MPLTLVAEAQASDLPAAHRVGTAKISPVGKVRPARLVEAARRPERVQNGSEAGHGHELLSALPSDLASYEALTISEPSYRGRDACATPVDLMKCASSEEPGRPAYSWGQLSPSSTKLGQGTLTLVSLSRRPEVPRPRALSRVSLVHV